jgi:transposase
LEGSLLGFWEDMKSEKDGIAFQQDNAPSHTAKTTMKWFDDHDIDVFPHPPSSPDANPIEPVWHELKNAIRARPHAPSSLAELKVAVVEA